MNRLLLSACLVAAAAAAPRAEAATREILFVGNSFTHGAVEPTYSYNKGTVTDANGTGMAGVPAIFKKMIDQSGLSGNVTIEAVSGETLQYHYSTKAAIIGQAKWDDIVLQEYSTRPLPSNKGGNIAAFNTALGNLKALIVGSSGADIHLYETWARPDLTFPAGQPYSGQPLSAMQTDLHNAYYAANATFGFAGVAPVGDAFLRAVNEGVANPKPYQAAPAGTLDIWDTDRYHASKYGSYLSAAVMLAELTDVDPRTLATGANTAAAGLGIASADAQRLNLIAYEATVPEPTTLAALAGVAVLALRRRR